MYLAYELRAHLKHLIISEYLGDGEFEWIGKKEDWNKVEKEIRDFEEAEYNFNPSQIMF